jgi:putative transposase
MAEFQKKYRIESIRAQWWDYGWNGAYFITICTHNRQHFFGKIIKGKMELSHMGAITDTLWHEIPIKFKYTELGDFVVMPNHIHGILILDKPEGQKSVVPRLIAAPLQIPSPPSPEKIPGGFAGTK